MNKNYTVLLVGFYLATSLASLCYLAYLLTSTKVFQEEYKLLLGCLTIGGIGGVLYCFRGIYLNFCVLKQWTNEWIPWYLIRPIVSILCGGASYLFLRAGLLILESQKEANSTNLGFFAFAFIAGMNVDKFISKIEDIAQATWGIEKSRSSKIEK